MRAMGTVFFALAFLIGVGGAIVFLIRTPDWDRPLVYPKDESAWGGASTKNGVGVWNMVGSFLFWAIVVGVAGFFGMGISLFVDLNPLIILAIAFVLGLISAVIVGNFKLRAGPGMMHSLPKQRVFETHPKSHPRVLFICGSLNQTTQCHQVAKELAVIDAFYTPYYSDFWFMQLGLKLHMQEFAVSGYKRRAFCLKYLAQNNLPVDLYGEKYTYDLVVTSSDQIMPKNIKDKPIVAMQEGITDPPNFFTWLYRKFHCVPRFIAGTSTTGLSNLYDRFCVASEGYKDYFVKQGVDPQKVVVTGICNFDDCEKYYNNDFPYRDYVLVCTSDSRETFMGDDRKEVIENAVKIANGRQLIFKLHPNEKFDRATKEINQYAKGALVYCKGSAEQMVANCSVLITEWSSLTFVGLALNKEVHTKHNIDDLKALVPVQNKSAAKNIAKVCREFL